MPITIGLIASSEIVRRGLSEILSTRDFTVVWSGISAAEFYDKSASEAAVVVMAVEPEADISEASAQLADACPEARHVLVADDFDLESVVFACEHAIDGLLLKGAPAEQLACSLRLVALGERVLPGLVADYLVRNRSTVPHAAIKDNGLCFDLSGREVEILRQVAEGNANKVIARQLGITESTVKVHVKAILRKLRLANRTQAALWATQNIFSGTSQWAA